MDWLGAAACPPWRRQPTRSRCEDGGVGKGAQSKPGIAGHAQKRACGFRVYRAGDWVFPSILKLGQLPYSYTGVRMKLKRRLRRRLGHVASHIFRHMYRSWLDAAGTAVAVQQKMMRHTDIRTTMNIYGDVGTDEMNTAAARVADMAFRSNGTQTERVSG